MHNREAKKKLPILYSFRRCPYAMRARMALFVSGQQCELREVVLRDKPAEMIAASPKATVPVLVDVDGKILDESLAIMDWSLERHDPDNWRTPSSGSAGEMRALIARIDGSFKKHLDRYKYWSRYTREGCTDTLSRSDHRDAAMKILAELNGQLRHSRFLFGAKIQWLIPRLPLLSDSLPILTSPGSRTNLCQNSRTGWRGLSNPICLWPVCKNMINGKIHHMGLIFRLMTQTSERFFSSD